jgi:spore coat-associated protein N
MAFESHATTNDQSRKERRRMLRSAALLGMSLATVAILVTGAIFTDTQSVGANAFTTGTVDISTAPTTDLVSFTSPPMAPGDSVVDGVTVSNSGTLQFRYSVKSTTTGSAPLSAQLDMTVWDEAAEADAGVVCATTAPGTVLYGPADLGSAAGINIVGDPTQGGQLGDRTLAASASEVVCFKVLLPTATDNTYQGLTATATFAFAAEQTANN